MESAERLTRKTLNSIHVNNLVERLNDARISEQFRIFKLVEKQMEHIEMDIQFEVNNRISQTKSPGSLLKASLGSPTTNRRGGKNRRIEWFDINLNKFERVPFKIISSRPAGSDAQDIISMIRCSDRSDICRKKWLAQCVQQNDKKVTELSLKKLNRSTHSKGVLAKSINYSNTLASPSQRVNDVSCVNADRQKASLSSFIEYENDPEAYTSLRDIETLNNEFESLGTTLPDQPNPIASNKTRIYKGQNILLKDIEFLHDQSPVQIHTSVAWLKNLPRKPVDYSNPPIILPASSVSYSFHEPNSFSEGQVLSMPSEGEVCIHHNVESPDADLNASTGNDIIQGGASSKLSFKT